MHHFIAESYFDVVTNVNDTWARVKALPNYREEFGVALFRRMFEVAPDAWTVFPWGRGNKNDEDMFKNPEFLKFARRFTEMLDMAIDMLGPDMELVEEQLTDIGIMHSRVGVVPRHYPLMGACLIDTLADKLGPETFTRRHRDAWGATFQFMSTTMLQGAFDDMKRKLEGGGKKNGGSMRHSVL
ncbi:Neuroglobin [Seminavis robusta]|uniref:Neuroglobin n=1 Tax=Seminavis robusta TaxID=568900 RepID=A0A9N8F015_9STRA|nr:Neuroglobin [Seminavis robusta]|eukprot:Sro2346_g324220.1 Neuroglobin (184) ;mRNA; f:10393-11036